MFGSIVSYENSIFPRKENPFALPNSKSGPKNTLVATVALPSSSSFTGIAPARNSLARKNVRPTAPLDRSDLLSLKELFRQIQLIRTTKNK